MANFTPSIQELEDELQFVIKKIKCACHEAEVQASYSMCLPPSLYKQRSPYGLETTVMALRGMARCPLLGQSHATSSTPSKRPVSCPVPGNRTGVYPGENCKCSVKGEGQQLSTSSPKSPYSVSSGPKRLSVNCVPNDSKPCTCEHPDFPNCSCRVIQNKCSEPIRKVPIGCKDCCLPNDPNASTCMHPKFPYCPCEVPSELLRYPNVPKGCKEACLPNDPSSGICFPNCPCGPADKPTASTDAERNVRKVVIYNVHCKKICAPIPSTEDSCVHPDFPNCPCNSEFKSALDIPCSTPSDCVCEPKQPNAKSCNHRDNSCCACEIEIFNKNTCELTTNRSCDHPDYPFCPCETHDRKQKHVGTNTPKSVACGNDDVRPRGDLPCSHPDYPYCPCGTDSAKSTGNMAPAGDSLSNRKVKLIDKCTCPEPEEQPLTKTELNRKMPQKGGAPGCFCTAPKRSMIPCSCASPRKKAQERPKSKSPARRPRSSSPTKKKKCPCQKAEKKNACGPSQSKAECGGRTSVKQMELDPSAISSTVKINEVKRLSPDSLIIKWERGGKRGVRGYEIEVDGIIKSRVFSGGRTSAVLHAVDLKDALNLAVYCTNANGRFDAPARAIFQA